MCIWLNLCCSSWSCLKALFSVEDEVDIATDADNDDWDENDDPRETADFASDGEEAVVEAQP